MCVIVCVCHALGFTRNHNSLPTPAAPCRPSVQLPQILVRRGCPSQPPEADEASAACSRAVPFSPAVKKNGLTVIIVLVIIIVICPPIMIYNCYNYVLLYHNWYNLVGGIPTPLKNMSSPVGIIIPNIWKRKKCSKSPTGNGTILWSYGIMWNHMESYGIIWTMEWWK